MREETLHQNHEESPPTAADSELGGASGGGAGGAETELGELGIGEGSSGVAVGGGGGGGGAVPVGGNRVKGPWSPEEDEVLTRLVGKFGARNWSLIARGIPGRSGKSCRLRWCNQLDPCLKRKPFTDEEDRIIISAHAVHGNKWAAIARLLPGRTDNAIKNHWNSTLRRRYADLGKLRPPPSEKMEAIAIERTKASSEETLSPGEVNPSKHLEGSDVIMEDRPNQADEKGQPDIQLASEQNGDPIPPRPMARVSAFSVYNPPTDPRTVSGMQRTVPCRGPLVQSSSRPDFVVARLLKELEGEPTVPSQCGYGCCATPSGGHHSQTSLLGPEFVEYEETPSFSSQELISIATDLNNIAWIRSSVESSNAASQRMPQGSASGSQIGIVKEHNMRNDHSLFDDGRNNLMGMMADVISTQMPRQTFCHAS